MNAPLNRDHPAPPRRRRADIRIARGFDELVMVYAIRAAVYMAEQECPYAEEFDGNDACAMHFIGFIGGEPAGCLRARFFADFVKLERLAVLKRFRRSTLAFDLVRSGIDVARKKGFARIYGHAREGVEAFWARFGAKPFADGRKVLFSAIDHTEMVIELEPHPAPITADSGGLVIVRPEGEWDEPGVLDASGARQSVFRAGNSVR